MSSMELIPGLPQELGLDCLTRLSYTTHRVGSRVCREWQQLLQCPDFYYHRKKNGFTHKVACLVQSLPHEQTTQKPSRKFSSSYGLTVFDPVSQTWDRLAPIPSYPNSIPMYCQVASCEGKLIVMGGWDPVSYNPVLDVFVYDFTTSEWKQGKNMPCKRSFFAIGAVGPHVYIAGGHDEDKNALKSAWTYDLKLDEWTELTQMSQGRDECEGVIVGNEFWVVSGYGTNTPGVFDTSAESYQIETGEWKRVEGVWKGKQCPRSCVRVASEGRKLTCWTESYSVVRAGAGAGASAVGLGEVTLLSGSASQGEPKKFFMLGKNQGQNGTITEITGVPKEFCGFVQSGCSAEI